MVKENKVKEIKDEAISGYYLCGIGQKGIVERFEVGNVSIERDSFSFSGLSGSVGRFMKNAFFFFFL